MFTHIFKKYKAWKHQRLMQKVKKESDCWQIIPDGQTYFQYALMQKVKKESDCWQIMPDGPSWECPDARNA